MNPYTPGHIHKTVLDPEKRKTPPTLEDDIPFGKIPTDHMFYCDFIPSKGGWQTPNLVPFENFSLSPDGVAFHYGQQIFEGMKAYKSYDQAHKVFLFRPEDNGHRFQKSALLMGMEPVPLNLFLEGVTELVKTDARWLLPDPASLYIRPALIPLDTGVSYRTSTSYRFFVVLSPSKTYTGCEKPLTALVERKRVRAFAGGVGEAKCGGNYAAAVSSLAKAKNLGCDQVIWLDGLEHRFVEEVGAMNIMFVFGKHIVTPALSGSILPGITRDSILKLAPQLGFTIEESKVDIDVILRQASTGELTECFACGTAAIVSPLQSFLEEGSKNPVFIKNQDSQKGGGVVQIIKDTLLSIQNGKAPDPFGWRFPLNP